MMFILSSRTPVGNEDPTQKVYAKAEVCKHFADPMANGREARSPPITLWKNCGVPGLSRAICDGEAPPHTDSLGRRTTRWASFQAGKMGRQ